MKRTGFSRLQTDMLGVSGTLLDHNGNGAFMDHPNQRNPTAISGDCQILRWGLSELFDPFLLIRRSQSHWRTVGENSEKIMAIREWRTESPVPHDVRLEHRWISGRAKIFVDENLVYERPRTIVDYGFRHEFLIDGKPHYVTVRPRGVFFKYSFGEIEQIERSSPESTITPTKSDRNLKWIVVAAVTPHVMVFSLIAFGTPVPIGNMPNPIPIRTRVYFGVVATINVIVMIRCLCKLNHSKPDSTRTDTTRNELPFPDHLKE